MIAFHFGFHQGGAIDLTCGEFLTDLLFFVVGRACGHRPRRQEQRGHMAKRRRSDHQPRHDLVTDPKKQRGVITIVRQGHGGGHRDHVARKQRQLHPGFALGDAVAHCGHTARDLGRGPFGAGCGADHVGKGLERLMGRQHVVIGGHDPKVGRTTGGQGVLIPLHRGIGMGLIPTTQMRAHRAGCDSGPDSIKIDVAVRARPFPDSVSYGFYRAVKRHGASPVPWDHPSNCARGQQRVPVGVFARPVMTKGYMNINLDRIGPISAPFATHGYIIVKANERGRSPRG